MRIIFPYLKHGSALEKSRTNISYERRDKLSYDLFKDMINIKYHRLVCSLSPRPPTQDNSGNPKCLLCPYVRPIGSVKNANFVRSCRLQRSEFGNKNATN